MNWGAPNIADEFKLFRQRMELCLLDNDVTDSAKQATKIKIAIGNEGLRRINASSLSEDDQKKPSKLWDLIEGQLNVSVNFRIQRLELMRYKQKPGETIDEFVNRCRTKAKECQFEEKELSERLVELVISSTQIEPFQKDLLDKPKGFSVDQLLEEGRKYEAILIGKRCLQTLQSPETSEDVDAIRQDNRRKCGNCGLFHPPNRCPAFRATCHACGTKGHWANMCRKTNQVQSRFQSFERTQGHSQDRQGQPQPFQSFERTQGHSQDRQGQPQPSKGHRVTRKTDRDNHPKVSTVHRNTRKTDRDNPDGDSQDMHISISPDRRSMK